MHLKILFLKMEYFTFSCTGLTNDFRFSNTHISPSKTHFAMPISLYLKRPLPSILSVFTFTVYSIDICSFTELKRVLSGKQYQNMYMSSENSRTTLMMKWNLFFQSLWKRRRDILITFPSYMKKLRSILRS